MVDKEHPALNAQYIDQGHNIYRVFEASGVLQTDTPGISDDLQRACGLANTTERNGLIYGGLPSLGLIFYLRG